jgi:hypothetical protein
MFCFLLIVYAEEKIKDHDWGLFSDYKSLPEKRGAGSVFDPLAMSSIASFPLAVPFLLTSQHGPSFQCFRD